MSDIYTEIQERYDLAVMMAANAHAAAVADANKEYEKALTEQPENYDAITELFEEAIAPHVRRHAESLSAAAEEKDTAFIAADATDNL